MIFITLFWVVSNEFQDIIKAKPNSGDFLKNTLIVGDF